MRKPLLLAVALVMLMTACRAEANFLLDVTEDGSGTVTVELGIDDELLELLEGFGGGTDDLLSIVPDDTEVETRREGDMTFYSGSETFTDTEDLLSSAAFLDGADTTFQSLELVVEDGAATLDAVIAAPDATEAAEGLGAGGLGGLGDIGEDIFSSSLIVSLPGSLVETNADEILSDGRLLWDVPILGGVVDVMAVTEAGGSGTPWGLIGGILVVVVIAAGAAWWMRRKRQGAVDAVGAAPAPAPASPVFDEPPTES